MPLSVTFSVPTFSVNRVVPNRVEDPRTGATLFYNIVALGSNPHEQVIIETSSASDGLAGALQKAGLNQRGLTH